MTLISSICTSLLLSKSWNEEKKNKLRTYRTSCQTNCNNNCSSTCDATDKTSITTRLEIQQQQQQQPKRRSSTKGPALRSLILCLLLLVTVLPCSCGAEPTRMTPIPTITTTASPIKVEDWDQELDRDAVLEASSAAASAAASEPPLLIVVTLMDGSVLSLSSDSGQLSSIFSTGSALVSSSSSSSSATSTTTTTTTKPTTSSATTTATSTSTTSTSTAMIVPDLDGNLYHKPTMQRLAWNMEDILATPVQTCHSNYHYQQQTQNHPFDADFDDLDDSHYHEIQEDEQCGIVTGMKWTSLYGMNARTGKLVWTSNTPSGSSSSASKDEEDDNIMNHDDTKKKDASFVDDAVVVLQREDYMVQHISSQTGSQLWNVTLGRFSALDLGAKLNRGTAGDTTGPGSTGPSTTKEPLLLDDDGIEDDDDDITMKDATSAIPLPRISFDAQGQILTLIDPISQSILWTRHFSNMIARVYGLQNGLWWPLSVIQDGGEEEDDVEATEDDYNIVKSLEEHESQQHQHHQLLLPVAATDNDDDIVYGKWILQHLQKNKDHQLMMDHGAIPSGWLNQYTYESNNNYNQNRNIDGHKFEPQRLLPASAPIPTTKTTAVTTSITTTTNTAPPTVMEHKQGQSQPAQEEGEFNFCEGNVCEPNVPQAPPRYHPPMEYYYSMSSDQPPILPPPWATTSTRTTSPTPPSMIHMKSPPISHSSDGLFLTWPMVATVLIVLVWITMILVYMYQNKKQQWIHQAATASAKSTTSYPVVKLVAAATNSSGDTTSMLPPFKEDHDFLPFLPLPSYTAMNTSPHLSSLEPQEEKNSHGFSFLNHDNHGAVANHTTTNTAGAVKRSVSLPVIGRQCSSPKNNHQQQQESRKQLQSSHSVIATNITTTTKETNKNKATTATFNQNGNSNTTTTNTTAVSMNHTNPTTAVKSTKDTTAAVATSKTSSPASSPALVPRLMNGTSGVTNHLYPNNNDYTLEGIPLVRYSRYRSEFTEVLPLGKGGFGSVFECENVLDGRRYAIKKVVIDIFQDNPELTQQTLQRVLREVKILAVLDHPNIVRYYTAWLELEEQQENINGKRRRQGNFRGGGGMSFTSHDDYLSEYPMLPSSCYSSDFLSNRKGGGGGGGMENGMKNGKSIKEPNPLGWNNFMNDFSQSSLFGMKRNKASMESLSMNDNADHNQHGYREAGRRETSRRVSFRASRHVTNEDDEKSWSSSSCDDDDDDDDDYSTDTDDDDTEHFLVSKSGSKRKNIKKSAVASPTKNAIMEPQLQHLLYIQMQLCTQRTLADFLANPEARKTRGGGKNNEIDIPYALFLFHQVAAGVKYVHSQDLIHRDLKPNNCFMDDTGVVKVGDFGLSRENNTDVMDNTSGRSDSLGPVMNEGDRGAAADNTAGVGTRSYASPEQLNGSDYDASTDIFSLGFILFELCYPMYTGMERHIVFSKLRQGDFPLDWKSGVAATFPDLHTMLMAMVSITPSKRPSAEVICRKMDQLLGEFMVLSIDESLHDQKSSSVLLLRVEAEPSDGILSNTMRLIKDAAPGVIVDQYGLRGGENNNAIIEFALSGITDLTPILCAMRACPDIKMARQVSSKIKRERSQSVSDS